MPVARRGRATAVRTALGGVVADRLRRRRTQPPASRRTLDDPAAQPAVGGLERGPGVVRAVPSGGWARSSRPARSGTTAIAGQSAQFGCAACTRAGPRPSARASSRPRDRAGRPRRQGPASTRRERLGPPAAMPPEDAPHVARPRRRPGEAIGDRGDGPRGVRPDARQRLEALDGLGDDARRGRRRSPSPRDGGDGAPVVAEAGPRPEGVRDRCLREDSTDGKRAIHAVHASAARAACVCCAMSSLTRTAYGSVVARNASSRPVASYQARIACRAASRVPGHQNEKRRCSGSKRTRRPVIGLPAGSGVGSPRQPRGLNTRDVVAISRNPSAAAQSASLDDTAGVRRHGGHDHHPARLGVPRTPRLLIA